MTTFQRYVLYQIPGWILSILLLAALNEWVSLPLWAAALLFAAWVVKDFAIYPFVRIGYEREKTGIEKLIGAPAVVKHRLDPQGFVEVGGELWKAEAPSSQAPLERGRRVRILGEEGMTLLVAAEEDAGTPEAEVR